MSRLGLADFPRKDIIDEANGSIDAALLSKKPSDSLSILTGLKSGKLTLLQQRPQNTRLNRLIESRSEKPSKENLIEENLVGSRVGDMLSRPTDVIQDFGDLRIKSFCFYWAFNIYFTKVASWAVDIPYLCPSFGIVFKIGVTVRISTSYLSWMLKRSNF